MEKRKVLSYHPRKNFWKFWEKRMIRWEQMTLNKERREMEILKQYWENGTLKKQHVFEIIDGRAVCKEYVLYYPNGQEKEYGVPGRIKKEFYDNGMLREIDVFSEKKIVYYPNGHILSEKDHKTHAYTEYSMTGSIVRKGTLRDNKFFPGNLEQKQKDTKRQNFVRIIDSVAGLPVKDPCRKLIKRNMALAWRMARAGREMLQVGSS